MTSISTSPVLSAGSRYAEPGRYLTFRVGGGAFGLPVARVRELIRRQAALTRLPQMPAYVSGCLNLRGTVIPVIDLRIKFEVPPEGVPGANCVIIAEVRALPGHPPPVGLVVDAVEEVVLFKAADLEPAPEFGGGIDTGFMLGMAKHKQQLVTLLNLDAVLASGTLRELQQPLAALPAGEVATPV